MICKYYYYIMKHLPFLWHLSNLDNNNNIIIKSYAAEFEIFCRLKNCSVVVVVLTVDKISQIIKVCLSACVCNCACWAMILYSRQVQQDENIREAKCLDDKYFYSWGRNNIYYYAELKSKKQIKLWMFLSFYLVIRT